MNKAEATPVGKDVLVKDIDSAVKYLQKCKRNGQNVYIDFNGHKLYSCDVTLDSAYMEVIGMTKEEDEAIRKEFEQAKTEDERKAIIEKWNSIRKRNQLKLKEAELSNEEAEADVISKEEKKTLDKDGEQK